MSILKPGTYHIRGKFTQTNVGTVEVLKVTETYIRLRRRDGREGTLTRDQADALEWIPVDLETARAKIASARFSPARLVDESQVYGNDCPTGKCEM